MATDEVGRYWTSTASETGEFPAASDALSESGAWIAGGEEPQPLTPNIYTVTGSRW